MRVYLAGKISKNGWRDKIIPDLRSHVTDIDGGLSIISAEPAKTFLPYLLATGPFFISCDHGCYHGENSHGVGANGARGCACGWEDDCPDKRFPPNLVHDICMKQLEASDFVFAYIDSWSCFGTLCEIGYAHAKRIPVVIYFASKELQEGMWFAAECADIVFRSSGNISQAKDRRFIPVASKIVGRIYSEGNE